MAGIPRVGIPAVPVADAKKEPALSVEQLAAKAKAAIAEVDTAATVTAALDINDQIGTYAGDYVDTANVLAKSTAKLGKFVADMSGGNKARVLGAAAGAVMDAIKPAPGVPSTMMATVASNLGETAGKAGALIDAALDTAAGQMATKALTYAGLASVAYNTYAGFTDETFQTTGGKVANAIGSGLIAGASMAELAVSGAIATGMISATAGAPILAAAGPIGMGIMAAEVLSGGGVSGSVKGLVAMGEGAFTGDNAALDQWKADAKAGEFGWVVSAVANNETASTIANAAAETVVGGVVNTVKAVGAIADATVSAVNAVGDVASNAASAVSNSVSSAFDSVAAGWNALSLW